jgi:hypothetical protein
MFEIVRSKKESDRVSDYVALGNLLDDKTNSYHSAFVIQYNNELYEFHYTGSDIELISLRRDYFHKITDTININEVPAFLAQCTNIQKNANPKYGYFYSGESYDINGNHSSNSNLGEVMTCVGFCLNVLKGFHEEEDYIEYSDWNSDSHEEPNYLKNYCDWHGLDPEKIQSSHRRITPRELLISGFFKELPIRKFDIDKKKSNVENIFSTREDL